MTSLVIVGNGFDRFHRLPTGYEHYRSFLRANKPSVAGAFEEFPYLYEDANGEGRWSDVEKVLTLVAYDECVDDALSAYPLDLMADNPGWNDPAIWIDAQTAFVKDFTGEAFLRWLRSIDLTQAKGEVLFPEDSAFVTFNYTTTLEDRYGIPASRVLHIHGVLDDAADPSAIQFGSPYNDPDQARSDLERLYGAEDFYGAMIQQCVVGVVEYCKAGSKCLPDNYQALRDHIGLWEVDRVIVFGHSFDGVDKSYYNDVLLPMLGALPWTFVVYGEKDAEKAARFCRSAGIKDYSLVSSKDVSVMNLR